MKYFQLVGAFNYPMSRISKDCRIVLAGDDSLTIEKFQGYCKQMAAKLKKKYQADNPDIPMNRRKTKEEIIREIATLLEKRHGMRIIALAGEYKVYF